MAQGNRMQRVAALIQHTLADILLRETRDLGIGMATITQVSLAKDLSTAKVFVSVLEEDKVTETIAALNNAARYIRHLLAQSKIEIRITPELKFIYDDSTARGNRISSLLNDALKKASPQDDQ